MERSHRINLLRAAWGVFVLALIEPYLPDSLWGAVSKGTLLWSAFYPAAIRFGEDSEARYWTALPVVLGTFVFLYAFAKDWPYRAEAAAVAGLIAVVLAVATSTRRRTRHSSQE